MMKYTNICYSNISKKILAAVPVVCSSPALQPTSLILTHAQPNGTGRYTKPIASLLEPASDIAWHQVMSSTAQQRLTRNKITIVSPIRQQLLTRPLRFSLQGVEAQQDDTDPTSGTT